MRPGENLSVLKIDVWIAPVNRKKIRICYNECYRESVDLVSFKVSIHCFSAVVHVELFINIMYVLPHGDMADIKTISNFFV